MPAGLAGGDAVSRKRVKTKMEPSLRSSRNVLQRLLHSQFSCETQITSGPIRLVAEDPAQLGADARAGACRRERRDHTTLIDAPKKQGRRRSMPSTTLPAPDIEIGSRHPVNHIMTRIRTVKCEPVHNRRRKFDSLHPIGPGMICNVAVLAGRI